MNDSERAEDKGQSPPLPAAELAKKRAVLHLARADHAIKGEPTSGLPGEQERGRAEDVVPPPQGETDQTR
jgi:hypothetical protein